jgi:hypothetical protein
MNSIGPLCFVRSLVAVIALISFADVANCQVNETELEMWFRDARYKRYRERFYGAAKQYTALGMKQFPRGSSKYENLKLMKALFNKRPQIMEAAPFLDLKTSKTGDLGMMSVNAGDSGFTGRPIPYVKVFQSLGDNNQALMKCSFDPDADDDEWSRPFLWVVQKGSQQNDNRFGSRSQLQEGSVSKLGFLFFQRFDDFVYTDTFGARRQVPAFCSLDLYEWLDLAKQYKK